MRDINVGTLGTIVGEMTATPSPSPQAMLRIDHPTHQDQGIWERGACEWGKGDWGLGTGEGGTWEWGRGKGGLGSRKVGGGTLE